MPCEGWAERGNPAKPHILTGDLGGSIQSLEDPREASGESNL